MHHPATPDLSPVAGLFAPWVPLATGGFVRFYDATRQPLLKPIRSPFLQEAVVAPRTSRQMVGGTGITVQKPKMVILSAENPEGDFF